MVLLNRLGEQAVQELDLLVYRIPLDVRSVDLDRMEAARCAYRRFGKGRHPAGLNYGDCFSYALASVTKEPLLYKGEDFARTDIDSALA